ncbi:MAG TPA: N-6 DNA methylase [Planctomycetota bacterium]|nr:N-6 DNA methylase [Planctomycetota bacterium]
METAWARGAFYTPAELAAPLCAWAVRGAGDTVLDPSCGDGAFLGAALDRLRDLGAEMRRLPDLLAGVELDGPSLARARGRLLSRHPALRWGRLVEADFFAFAEEWLGRLQFDAVVGNPPYLRTQGRPPEQKARALAVARRAGAELTADASAWAPFVAAAAAFVRPGGRLAMIVPREALFVNYARPLRAHLERRFGRVEIVPLDGDWFDGAQVKVAVLRAEGMPAVESPPRADRPWVWGRIPEDCRAAAARRLDSPDLVPVRELATLLVGVVTGDRDYFLVPPDAPLPREMLLPAVSTPTQLTGATLAPADVAGLERLLAVPPDYAGGHPALDRYLEQGRSRGVADAYKCRTRRPWFSVRRMLPPPDLFLGYLVKRRPRMAANEAGAHSTNNVHRLYLRDGGRGHAGLLAAAAYSAPARLAMELTGRVSAGGALKLEPGDTSRLRLPRPEALLSMRGAPRRARAIDAALREGRDADAFALADDWVGRALGWDRTEMGRLARAADALREARLGPGT